MSWNKQSKLINMSRITWCIWQYGSISRVEISKKLGLDKSTVTIIVAELLETGLIYEIRMGAAGRLGGRRPIYLGINKEFGYVIGIKFQTMSFTAVAVDLSGEIIAEHQESLEITTERISECMRYACQASQTALKQPGKKLFGIGIGMSALVNSQEGIIMMSNPFSITYPLPLYPETFQGLGAPVFVDNDANCCAYGELAFTKASSRKNFLFALVEYRPDAVSLKDAGGLGIGLGLVIDGKLHHGSGYTAGEFRSVLGSTGERSQLTIGPEELAHMFDNPSVLEKVARELTRNLALLVNVLNLEEIIFGGEIENGVIDFPKILRESIKENWIYRQQPDFTSRYSALGRLSVAYGAAGMSLERLMLSNRFLVSARTGLWAEDRMAYAQDQVQGMLVRSN